MMASSVIQLQPRSFVAIVLLSGFLLQLMSPFRMVDARPRDVVLKELTDALVRKQHVPVCLITACLLKPHPFCLSTWIALPLIYFQPACGCAVHALIAFSKCTMLVIVPVADNRYYWRLGILLIHNTHDYGTDLLKCSSIYMNLLGRGTPWQPICSGKLNSTKHSQLR